MEAATNKEQGMPKRQYAIRAASQPINLKIALPGAKAITHRAILLGSLAEGVSEITNIHLGASTLSMIKALKQLGIAIQLDMKAKTCIIAGDSGKFPKKQTTVWCEKSSAIAEYLLTACACSDGLYYFDASKKVAEKTNTVLLNLLVRQGAQLIPTDTKKMPFTLVGCESFEGGEISLNKPVNYSMLSALLMTAPFSRSHFTFNLPDGITHSSIEMTCNMMAEFGVLVHRVHQAQLMVPTPQRYQARDYIVEPDLGLGCYFFAATAITNGNLTIQSFKRSSCRQPSSQFLFVLEKMGCIIKETALGLNIQGPKKLHGIEVSLRNFADAFFALTAIAPFCQSPIRITHIGPITQKEHDDLTAVKKNLTILGIHVESGNDWIKIFPGVIKPAIIDTQDNYRLAMSFAVIGLRVNGMILENCKRLKFVYPDFFEMWKHLAENVNINASTI